MIGFPVYPYNPPNKDSHAYWEDFFSPEELEKIASFPEWGALEEGKVNPDAPDSGVSDRNIRRSKISWLQQNNDNLFVWEKFSHVLGNINSQFFQFDISGMYEPIQLTQYESSEAGYYGWHTDMDMGQRRVVRKLSMVFMLSDPADFSGGELQIKTTGDTAKTLEFVKGRAWFFPSWVLHRVTPVTSGVRKTLVLWAGGPPFR